MKYFVSIMLCIVLFTCKAQDSEFKAYLTNFSQSKLPISIFDRQSSSAIFCQRHNTLSGMMPKIIPEKFAKKFICTGSFCNPDGGYFRYDYGVKIDLNKGYSTVLVSKLQYEGKTEWDFDLGEILLLIYNNRGEILSRQSLTKDNDRWKSNLKITKEGIVVRQIKITELKMTKGKELSCEVWTTEYQLTNDGKIKVTKASPISKKKVVWDKTIEDYKLKN